jgi:hypothetical protein
MRNLRMTMPQYITNLSSFEDSVRILKNKGILTEADMNENMSTPTEQDIETALRNMFDDGLIDDIAWKTASKALDNFDIEGNMNMAGPTTAEDLAKELVFIATGEDVQEQGDDYDMDYEEPNEPFDMAESLNEAKDEKGKWTNTNGKSMYDQFSEINNLNGQEVLIGIDYEREKNPELTKAAAAKIVVKNLKKNPIYYTSTLMSGIEGYEPEYIGGKSANPEAHQMQYLDKNMGNVVDKKRGMQPVKGIEKAKKDSDKGGEINKTVKGVELMSLIAKTVRGMKKMDATGEKMKKIMMKEGMEGQYTFNGYFKGGELDKLMTMIPDAEIDDQVEYGQGTKTTIFSQQYSDEEIRKAVNSVIGMPGTKKDVPGTIFNKNAGITAGLKSLTKDELMEIIRKEIAGAYGGDAMDPEDGSSYTND